ncbi:unnamed protein product [Rotaria sp. Silwood2]|nr:unnamed protein product [Rotaria sp. Silwood2]CAF3230506.1 unnamed protein product [Rotaria sp. Silwood2]CAF3318777.1 unnamed protein product [Rotaria sp. Silwood2]CAF3946632.1 unnamed protein product [Rotaria sp. Silwood2]CAF4385019.1 unnamed protein product [Rotaria sp. Silwood2]
MLIEWLILVTSILSILISISFVLFVIFASSIHSASIALTCHSSITVIMANTFLLLNAIFMLKINLENNLWCEINAYCFQVSLILIYHSYYLQAFHRFTSVVYHHTIYFRTYHIFLAILILQWIFAWFYPFRLLKLGLFTYNPIINACHLNWNLSFELFLLLSIEYFIPLIIDAIFYISVIKHAHLHIAQITHHSHSQHRNQIIISQEQRRINREFKMLKRIIIFYLALVIMNFPSLILTIISAVDLQHSISLEYSYKIILVFISCILLLISIFQFILTPSVKTLIHDFIKRRTNQVFG